MALPSIFTNKKFVRSVHRLNIPDPHILGLLEYLWNSAYDAADDFVGDEIDIELAAKWTGEPGVLFKVLVDENWLDKCDDGRIGYIIHDFWEHAPDYISKRAERRAQRELKGETISNIRRAAALKRWEKQRLMQTDANDRDLDNSVMQTDANIALPLPPSPSLSSPMRDSSAEAEQYSPEFLRFWELYPEKTGKGKTWEYWKKKRCNSIIDKIIESLNNHIGSKYWVPDSKGETRIPNPATWINQRRWEDTPQKASIIKSKPTRVNQPYRKREE